MGADEVNDKVVGEWASLAEDDLTVAVHTLRLGAECPSGVVCFHAQQCAEKYLKAVLVARGVAFPKVHDIEKIISLLPADLRPALTVAEQRLLTGYAIVPRYPSAGEAIALPEARRAVRLAKRVRTAMRKHLPKCPRE